MSNIDVVIIGGSANALGILRSLAPSLSCLVLADDERLPVFQSRFGQKKLVENTKSETIIDELEKIGPTFNNPPVLFLSEENTVEQVSLHRDRLNQYYCFSMVNHNLVIDLQSKSAFQILAENHQSPIPKANVVKKSVDIEKGENLTFPCVFKPLYQDAAYSKRFKKAYKVNNLDEVKDLYHEIQPIMPDMILQEWLHGKDSEIYFCLAYFGENSQLVDAFSGRKLRSWPLNIGGTASCTNAPEAHQELKEITTKFAQSIAYRGLLGMEFKYDNQRGGFYMIEPTVARTDYQHEIATLSGHNLLLQIYFHLRKGSVPKFSLLHRSVIWCDEIADANALANGGDKTEPLSAKKYFSVKRWQDPLPYLHSIVIRIKRRIGIV
jgi:predicted ATP-grasp superfamily ATP-dependent carboligase